MNINKFKQAFGQLFQGEPTIIKSPGRINVIGEHTDYNQGLVMPAAIDKAIYVGISNRSDEQIHLYSENYQQTIITSVSQINKSDRNWANYVLGVVDQIQRSGYWISGFNLYIHGDVPLGAGLSSSAALECATAYAINHLNRLDIPRMDLAKMAQKAEHAFAGVNCGIMDQFASLYGQKDHAVLLDCRKMSHEYIPLKLDGYKFLLLNTNVKHSLSESAYNERRIQCETGVSWIKRNIPGVTSLRDADLFMLDEFVKPIDEDVYQKCRYVIEEIARTKLAAESLKNGNLEGLGSLMFETHTGLSEIYQVSCEELDFLVDHMRDYQSVLGARMMGGGFGGCTINIVKEQDISSLIAEVAPVYKKEFGIELSAYSVETANGSELLN